MPSVQIGDKWLVGRHIVYCEDTSSNKFINLLPSAMDLALITPSFSWNHNYSLNKARIVVVILEEDGIYDFCNHQQMPFRFELLIDGWYIAIFSYHFIHKPSKLTEIKGIEGIISFLLDRYSNQGDSILAPFLRNGEILMICEKMGRICIAGDNNPHRISRTLIRWQNWTNMQAQKA